MIKYFLLLAVLAPNFSWAKYYIDFTTDKKGEYLIVVEDSSSGKSWNIPITKEDFAKGSDFMVQKAYSYVEANK